MTIAINAFGAPASGFLPRQPVPDLVPGMTCAVRLIDRRTGRPHRIGGSALTVFTKTPVETAAEILSGRDPEIWEARIEPLTTTGGHR
ncbi:MAG: hypothetical protein U1D35_06505 [Paracoccaceae bacterium]|nr:hypothetical protein [Paracoccaceae bacterium]